MNFNEIEDVTLQTWNRCTMASNILEDKGEAASQRYIEQFSELDKKRMLLMYNYIKQVGYEKTLAEVSRNNGTLEA